LEQWAPIKGVTGLSTTVLGTFRQMTPMIWSGPRFMHVVVEAQRRMEATPL